MVKVRDKAKKLELTELTPTILYAQPRKMRPLYSKIKPDIADMIGDYMKGRDPSFIEDATSSRAGKNGVFYLLAPQIKLYAKVDSRIAAAGGWAARKFFVQISIFSEDHDHIREIASMVNQLWYDGILANIDWVKLEKKFKVKKEEVSAAWEAILKLKESGEIQLTENETILLNYLNENKGSAFTPSALIKRTISENFTDEYVETINKFLSNMKEKGIIACSFHSGKVHYMAK